MYERQSMFVQAMWIPLAMVGASTRLSNIATLMCSVVIVALLLAGILPSYLIARRSEAVRLRAEHEELQAMEKVIGRKLI
jgi:hypothetical protein